MTAQHGIVGSDSNPIDIPKTQPDPAAFIELESDVRFAKSAGYKKLKAHLEDRIAYYQQCLPDGTPVSQATQQQRQDNWGAANTVIAEYKAAIAYYEQAEGYLKDAKQSPRT